MLHRGYGSVRSRVQKGRLFDSSVSNLRDDLHLGRDTRTSVLLNANQAGQYGRNGAPDTRHVSNGEIDRCLLTQQSTTRSS